MIVRRDLAPDGYRPIQRRLGRRSRTVAAHGTASVLAQDVHPTPTARRRYRT